MLHLLILFFIIVNSFCVPVPSLSKSSIVGGSLAKSISYQVSLEFHGSHMCGGSIISKRVILTAGHCVDLSNLKFYKVRVGTNIRGKDGYLVNIKDAIIHPKYSLEPLDYDIAALFLEKILSFSNKVYSITLPETYESIRAGTMVTISGWGLDHEDGIEATMELMIAKVPIVNKTRCAYFVNNFTDRMICAGYDEGKIDACTMDSGGPLVSKGKLFAIISGGIGCALEYRYGIYTNVVLFRLWIDEIIQKSMEIKLVK